MYLLCKIMRRVIKRRRLLKPNKAVNEMENTTPHTQRPIMNTNKEGLQVPIPNDDQGTIATETTGTMTTTSTDTKLGTHGTPTIIHCTRNNKAQRPITTTVHCLGKEFAHEINFTYHDLQHKTVHQLKQISKRKLLDAIIEANTQINQNYLSTLSKPKPLWKNRTIRHVPKEPNANES